MKQYLSKMQDQNKYFPTKKIKFDISRLEMHLKNNKKAFDNVKIEK